MNAYDLAVYFWSTVVTLGLVAPFAVALVRDVKHTVQHLHDHEELPSLVSAPIPSRPSGC